VLVIVHRVITGFLISQSGLKRTAADAGAVTPIQRFGLAANLNIHLHCLVFDGVYRRTEGDPVFDAARAPTGDALAGLLDLISFHGVLAPNARLRAAVIPQPARKDSAPGQEHTRCQAARMRWARLLKRVFHIDVERCACGGQLKVLAAIEEPVVIVRILTHLGLPARAPPRAAAREFSLDYAA
jgi:hypothetical protein